MIENQDLEPPSKFIKEHEPGILKNESAIVPIDHLLEAYALAFLDAMTPGVKEVLGHEQGGIKFTLVLTADVKKVTP